MNILNKFAMDSIVAVQVYNAKLTQAFSRIPSHVSGSHGHNVINGCIKFSVV